MSFADIQIKPSYQSYEDDILGDFLIPVLKEAKTYDRAVGYFSSSSLICLSKGLYRFVQNHGKIRILCSPQLTEEDFKSIRKGYDERLVVEQALLKSLLDQEVFQESSKNRLSFLSKLIAEGIADLRIAFSESGIFHTKIGLVSDNDGREIMFTGSLNETEAAYCKNFETIDVFSSWLDLEAKKRIQSKRKFFDSVWEGQFHGIKVIRSELIENTLIKKYLRKNDSFPNQDDVDISEVTRHKKQIKSDKLFADFPCHLRPYQKNAIREFINHNGRGIFDMATGTGKTITALGAIHALLTQNNQLGIIITVPLTYLVEQWAKDIKAILHLEPICASGEHNWKDSLSLSLYSLQKSIRKGQPYNFCIITTNNTFASNTFQQSIQKLKQKDHLFLIVDEAHNFGTENKRNLLDDKFTYRLALSATFERHRDEAGSDALSSYFSPRCISYSLEQAIQEGFLTPYKYHPHFVSMTENERLAYIKLSKEISRYQRFTTEGKSFLDPAADSLLMERARLVATISNKVNELEAIVNSEKFAQKNGILVYCGTSGVLPHCSDYIDSPLDESGNELRQIDEVATMLIKHDIKAAQYISNISAADRVRLISDLQSERLQALVAIKCLDEGVDIPNVRFAFILASTTNPKEYIQRRGRVLRKSPGKDLAVIYDFITLPYPIDECVELYNKGKDETIRKFRTLIAKEALRMKDFLELAKNKIEVNNSFLQLCQTFSLNPSNPGDFLND